MRKLLLWLALLPLIGCSNSSNDDDAQKAQDAAPKLSAMAAKAEALARHDIRAMDLCAEGDYDGAIAEYDLALKIDPQDARTYFQRGNVHYQKGDYDRAIADYDQAIRFKLDDARALAHRGAAWQAKGELDRAIADFTAALQLDDELTQAYLNRGIAWHDQGEYDKAVADYSAVIRLEPQNAKAYYNRGIARDDQGDYEQAIADYTEAIQLDPDFALAYGNRAWIYALCPEADRRDGQQAVEDATRACELTTWKNDALVETLAAACAENGDFDAAVKWLKKAIEIAPAKRAESRQRMLAAFQRGQLDRDEPQQ